MMNRFVLAALAFCMAAPASAATIETYDLRTPASTLLGGAASDFTVTGANLVVLPNGIAGLLGDSLAALLNPQMSISLSDDGANGLSFTGGGEGGTSVSFGGSILATGISGLPSASRMTLGLGQNDQLHLRFWTDTAQHYDIMLATAFVSAPSAVPEPGSWALMIAGLGLAGLGLRFRAKDQRAFT